MTTPDHKHPEHPSGFGMMMVILLVVIPITMLTLLNATTLAPAALAGAVAGSTATSVDPVKLCELIGEANLGDAFGGGYSTVTCRRTEHVIEATARFERFGALITRKVFLPVQP